MSIKNKKLPTKRDFKRFITLTLIQISLEVNFNFFLHNSGMKLDFEMGMV